MKPYTLMWWVKWYGQCMAMAHNLLNNRETRIKYIHFAYWIEQRIEKKYSKP